MLPELTLLYYAVSIVGGGIAFATFWMALSSRITKAQSTADAVTKQAAANSVVLAAMRESFTAYREQAAERFATHSQLTVLESEMSKTLLGITSRLDTMQRDMYARLDTIVGLVKSGK
jgi:hypothetical protein